MAEILEQFDLDEWEIETDTGWEDCSNIMKTIPYQIYTIILENGIELRCADIHILYDENMEEIYTKDLKIGQRISTKNGFIRVKEIQISDDKENMYDVSVNSENHRYYTNDILSHNSTTTGAYILHFAMFQPNQDCWILAHKESAAKTILGRIKIMYENLPLWLKTGVVEYNKMSIVFDNGSKITIAGTSREAVTGESISLLMLDEFSKVQPGIAEDFWNSAYPTISAGGKIIVVSTPKGIGNRYHQIWKAANKKNSASMFKPYQVDWWQVPGRDENWKKATIAEIGAVNFAQEHGNDFIGSSQTLIDASVLKKLDSIEPLNVDKHYKVYEEFDPMHTYIFGIDIAKGVKGDSSVIQIIRITGKPTQVAVYRNNEIGTFEFPAKILQLAFEWGSPYMIIENNSEGDGIINDIWYEHEYTEIFIDDKHSKKTQLGVRATTKSKAMATSLLKKWIEKGIIDINDAMTIQELTTFIERRKGIFEADENCHDDTVAALYWCIYMLESDWFKAIYDISKQEEQDNIQKMINENKEKQLENEAWGILRRTEDESDIEREFKMFLKN